MATPKLAECARLVAEVQQLLDQDELTELPRQLAALATDAIDAQESASCQLQTQGRQYVELRRQTSALAVRETTAAGLARQLDLIRSWCGTAPPAAKKIAARVCAISKDLETLSKPVDSPVGSLDQWVEALLQQTMLPPLPPSVDHATALTSVLALQQPILDALTAALAAASQASCDLMVEVNEDQLTSSLVASEIHPEAEQVLQQRWAGVEYTKAQQRATVDSLQNEVDALQNRCNLLQGPEDYSEPEDETFICSTGPAERKQPEVTIERALLLMHAAQASLIEAQEGLSKPWAEGPLPTCPIALLRQVQYSEQQCEAQQKHLEELQQAIAALAAELATEPVPCIATHENTLRQSLQELQSQLDCCREQATVSRKDCETQSRQSEQLKCKIQQVRKTKLVDQEQELASVSALAIELVSLCSSQSIDRLDSLAQRVEAIRSQLIDQEVHNKAKMTELKNDFIQVAKLGKAANAALGQLSEQLTAATSELTAAFQELSEEQLEVAASRAKTATGLLNQSDAAGLEVHDIVARRAELLKGIEHKFEGGFGDSISPELQAVTEALRCI